MNPKQDFQDAVHSVQDAIAFYTWKAQVNCGWGNQTKPFSTLMVQYVGREAWEGWMSFWRIVGLGLGWLASRLAPPALLVLIVILGIQRHEEERRARHPSSFTDETPFAKAFKKPGRDVYDVIQAMQPSVDSAIPSHREDISSFKKGPCSASWGRADRTRILHSVEATLLAREFEFKARGIGACPRDPLLEPHLCGRISVASIALSRSLTAARVETLRHLRR
ncbi:hypothetical protein CYMTET_52195 [Cymbomonas tetramitiformis]|uniref:Uncharacterized protein n=1 Tax=Cymbomonas tetramitiformis TaxID=36881 RepID=A0AAE0ERW3_9CHLO|nr:hypothetical protein CYMTET_52195 [Cymbomonas tetramitiformis]